MWIGVPFDEWRNEELSTWDWCIVRVGGRIRDGIVDDFFLIFHLGLRWTGRFRWGRSWSRCGIGRNRRWNWQRSTWLKKLKNKSSDHLNWLLIIQAAIWCQKILWKFEIQRMSDIVPNYIPEISHSFLGPRKFRQRVEDVVQDHVSMIAIANEDLIESKNSSKYPMMNWKEMRTYCSN